MGHRDMLVRSAQSADFEALYSLGKNTPEFRVSATEAFMDPEEFRWSMTDPYGAFLVAEINGKIVGFIYASGAEDMERPYPEKAVCLTYLCVDPGFRKQGIAQKLYDTCVEKLKSMGMTNIYGLVNAESDGAIVGFMTKNGFTKGHKFIWMDKKL